MKLSSLYDYYLCLSYKEKLKKSDFINFCFFFFVIRRFSQYSSKNTSKEERPDSSNLLAETTLNINIKSFYPKCTCTQKR